MKYNGFVNSYIKHIITIASLILGVLIGITGLWTSKTVVGCFIAYAVFMIFGVIAVINIVKNMIRHSKYNIVNYIDKEYLYSCDINIMSKLINNISNMCKDKDKCMDTYLECEYLSVPEYVCYGDEDIKYFINEILKGISKRYRYKVQETGYNRIIAIDLWDVNKKICIYITNLEDKQLISFRPIRKAQMMGLRVLNSSKQDAYKVEFYNPVLKYEIISVTLVLSLVLMAGCLLWNPYILIRIGRPLILVLILWTVLWCGNRKKINEMTRFPDYFMKNVNIISKHKDIIKNKICDNIIEKYNLNEHEEYLREVFKEKNIIYNEKVIFGKTDEEFDKLIKNSLDNITDTYKIHKVYGQDGSRQAGIEFDTLGVNIIITLNRLDDGQIIEVA